MLNAMAQEASRSQTTVLLASLFAVLLIHFLALIGLVTLNMTVVKRHGSALDLVFDGVVGTTQFLGDLVNRPAELEKNFNFVTFFAQMQIPPHERQLHGKTEPP